VAKNDGARAERGAGVAKKTMKRERSVERSVERAWQKKNDGAGAERGFFAAHAALTRSAKSAQMRYIVDSRSYRSVYFVLLFAVHFSLT